MWEGYGSSTANEIPMFSLQLIEAPDETEYTCKVSWDAGLLV